LVSDFSFGSIQNNIALKHERAFRLWKNGFGSIQNNIALNQANAVIFRKVVLVSIQNNNSY
ncbi:hypothetical protein, partial [Listeria monocytogenes]|uniref:hypothetical protein n=1 Tax=Listeria monocytogenes TaxID=1639 RepID=UPI0038B248B0